MCRGRLLRNTIITLALIEALPTAALLGPSHVAAVGLPLCPLTAMELMIGRTGLLSIHPDGAAD